MVSFLDLGELLFLLTGCYITYCIRNARKEIYREKWMLCISIYVETIVSTTTYILRHVLWSQLNPDQLFALYLTRCQVTVSIVLVLIFGPKVSFCGPTNRLCWKIEVKPLYFDPFPMR